MTGSVRFQKIYKGQGRGCGLFYWHYRSHSPSGFDNVYVR
nr:MAG TPA: hypothetical protein [Caudoviricetes sp.]